MIAKLLKFFPLKTILRAGAMLLISNRTDILTKVEGWIHNAQISIESGPAKMEWVKVRVLDLLKPKVGFLFDTGLQMLVAWFKLENPGVKFEPAAGAMETAVK